MSYDVAVDPKAHYTRVTVTGRPSFEEMLSLIHLLGVESETWKEHKVLMDLRGVVAKFSPAEEFRVGEEAAVSMSHMERIASVVLPERVTRVSEKAARRTGANVRVFDNEAAAIAWLEGP